MSNHTDLSQDAVLNIVERAAWSVVDPEISLDVAVETAEILEGFGYAVRRSDTGSIREESPSGDWDFEGWEYNVEGFYFAIGTVENQETGVTVAHVQYA